MVTTIECIESTGPDKRARRLSFSDLSEPRITSASVVRVLALEEGMEVDRAELDSALDEAARAQARERALRLLGYRERSTLELRTRLLHDGYPEAVVSRVTQRMAETGLLDDDRFARSWARSRAAAGFGPKRVLRELSRKGVDPGLSAGAVAEAYAERDALEAARRLIGNASMRTRRDRERAIRRLLRRGYDMSTALDAVECCAEQGPD